MKKKIIIKNMHYNITWIIRYIWICYTSAVPLKVYRITNCTIDLSYSNYHAQYFLSVNGEQKNARKPNNTRRTGNEGARPTSRERLKNVFAPIENHRYCKSMPKKKRPLHTEVRLFHRVTWTISYCLILPSLVRCLQEKDERKKKKTKYLVPK